MTKGYKVLNLETVSNMKKASKESVVSFGIDTDAIKAKERELKGVTDEEIMERLRSRFTILDDMTRAVKKGDVRAMIVTGPPGVGKSFGVEAVLSRHDVFANVAND